MALLAGWGVWFIFLLIAVSTAWGDEPTCEQKLATVQDALDKTTSLLRVVVDDEAARRNGKAQELVESARRQLTQPTSPGQRPARPPQKPTEKPQETK